MYVCGIKAILKQQDMSEQFSFSQPELFSDELLSEHVFWQGDKKSSFLFANSNAGINTVLNMWKLNTIAKYFIDPNVLNKSTLW